MPGGKTEHVLPDNLHFRSTMEACHRYLWMMTFHSIRLESISPDGKAEHKASGRSIAMSRGIDATVT